MKIKICFCTLLMLVLLYPISLKSQNKTDSVDLFLDIGGAYFPIDNAGGLLLGIKVAQINDRFGIAIRNDMFPNFDKTPITVNGFTTTTGQPLVLRGIQMNTYLDASIRLKYKQTKSVIFNAGFGWLTDGDGEYGVPSLRFKKLDGHPAITTAIQWNPSWFTLEVRGNFKLKEAPLTDGLNQFPVVIGLFREFRPGKK